MAQRKHRPIQSKYANGVFPLSGAPQYRRLARSRHIQFASANPRRRRRPRSPPRIDQEKVRNLRAMPFATNAGVRIHYETEGSGPPLVLHVGYMGRLEDWGRSDVGVVQALQNEYQLVLLDPRGFGASDKPHEPAAYGTNLVVGDVIAVLDDLGIDLAHFWGYSRGAAVGFVLGASKPNRVRSLILGGAHPYPRDPAPLIKEADTLRSGGVEAYVAQVEERVGAIPAQTRAAWLANDPLALAAVQLAASVATSHVEVDLSTIELPGLLYCGDRDPAHDRMKQAAESMLATFVTLPGLSHATTFQRAGELMIPRIRTFLAQLSD
jgi:pimeloyl-ACP methyl ester carboxylesterase